MKLKDKVAIVTGGARGIGKAYALAYAAEGAAVVIADVLDGTPACEEIVSQGGRAIALCTDVSNERSTQEMARQAIEQFGRIDVLMNNAGLFVNVNKKSFMDISAEEWDRVLAVNLKGQYDRDFAAEAVADIPQQRCADHAAEQAGAEYRSQGLHANDVPFPDDVRNGIAHGHDVIAVEHDHKKRQHNDDHVEAGDAALVDEPRYVDGLSHISSPCILSGSIIFLISSILPRPF